LLKEALKNKLMAPPRYGDVLVLAIFTILITLNPYFAHGKINIFEVGLYLPGIQSVLNGEVPYRDFFHLRGPFELYMPAFLMKVFGVHLTTLYSYFYFGNILCLILCIFIAKELFKTRYILYLMVPVLVGRTFPRVVFTYWGGMRYALGLLAVWFIVKFFKENKPKWMFGAGIVSALAGFTSVEMGAYPLLGVLAALIVSRIFRIQDAKMIFKSLGIYLIGLGLIAIPYGIYLLLHSALLPYIDATLTIVTRMQKVIDPHFVSVYPRNFPEAFAAMVNPLHTNFRHMTPSYLYISILVYLFYRLRRKSFSREDLAVICLGAYGFIMYNTGFRGIWAAQFEMALQPEKILLFFLLEIFLLISIRKKEALILKSKGQAKWYAPDRLKVFFLILLMLGLLGSSVGYAIARYNRRFFAFRFVCDKIAGKDTAYLKPFANTESRTANIKRASGIIIPSEQADELEQVAAFVERNVGEDEELMTYPEMGTYNFLVDRRHFGKFPISTFTWFNDRWHADYVAQLKTSGPRYIIVEKEIPQYWKDVYLALEPNRQKFRDVMTIISSDYERESETARSYIYKRKQ
jgi:hypothetical protein